jgi:hypothetical protein
MKTWHNGLEIIFLFLDLISAHRIIIRTISVYLVILVRLQLSGKCEIGQMTIFDLVVLLLIANAVSNAVRGLDASLIGGILAAAMLLVVNALSSTSVTLTAVAPLDSCSSAGVPIATTLLKCIIATRLHRWSASPIR